MCADVGAPFEKTLPGLPTASWPALGSTALVRTTEPWRLEPAGDAVRRVLAEADRACSRFRADSELTIVNARAGRPVTVSVLLQDAVEMALRGAELTGGLLDPCIGGALESAGYDRDWRLLLEGADDGAGERPSWRPRILARRRGGWRDVEVDRARGTVKIPTGTKLDLGATAKALAADRACAAAQAGAAGSGVLVSLGGDVAVRGRAPESGWRIHVTDDHRAGAGAPGQGITIESGGLATSSTTARRWRRGGEEMHHIIDPVSGRPAVTRWRTVSVAAGDCTDANIASTGALLKDAAAVEWLAGMGLAARLVELDGEVRTVGGWPAAAPSAGPVSRP
jgi:thiamine biosynthesis lipoprotein